MEEEALVDGQGRLVLPSRIREALGLKTGGEVIVRIEGPRAIIEPRSINLEKEVQEWATATLHSKAEAFSEEAEESWKWMSREYARRKLGLS